MNLTDEIHCPELTGAAEKELLIVLVAQAALEGGLEAHAVFQRFKAIVSLF